MPGADAARWKNERRPVRRGPGTAFRKLSTLRFLATRDRAAVARFLAAPYPRRIRHRDRIDLLRRFLRITNEVRGYHTLAELLTVTDRILRQAGRRDLTVVECGSGSGSSTAKLSLATRLAGGTLHVFDTFTGIPENTETHQLLDGRPLVFRKGAFRGRLGAVRKRVARYGAIEVCTFVKGPVEETLSGFDGPVDVVLLDLDLIASTRTAVARLYPRLRAGGSLLSQDGHLRATHALLGDSAFWRDDVGEEPPIVVGLGQDKLLEIVRPVRGSDATAS